MSRLGLRSCVVESWSLIEASGAGVMPNRWARQISETVFRLSRRHPRRDPRALGIEIEADGSEPGPDRGLDALWLSLLGTLSCLPSSEVVTACLPWTGIAASYASRS